MCEIRFHDVKDCTVHMFTLWRHPTQKLQNMAKWVCFWTLVFVNLIRWCSYGIKRIWHLLTVEIFFIKLALKNGIKLAKGLRSNIFQDSFDEILSQQLTNPLQILYVPSKANFIFLSKTIFSFTNHFSVDKLKKKRLSSEVRELKYARGSFRCEQMQLYKPLRKERSNGMTLTLRTLPFRYLFYFWSLPNPFPHIPFWDLPKLKEAADENWNVSFKGL